MNSLEFLTKNWSQITVVAGAIGYLLKIFLDYSIKKKEIKFGHIFKEKANAFQNFIVTYENFCNELTNLSFQYKYENISFQDFEVKMNIYRNDVRDKLNCLILYCSIKERESLYKILNSCSLFLSKIKTMDVDSIREELHTLQKTNRKLVDNFIMWFQS